MINTLAIFIAGGIGAVLRYLTGVFCTRFVACNLPIATLSVNIIGSFILAILFVFFINKTDINQSIKLALMVGFCGGFTTFSTFSLEVFELLKNGNYLLGISYIIISLALCLIATLLGFKLGEFIST